MREICESKDDLKFFMCELINTHIDSNPEINGDRKKFSNSTNGKISEPLLSRIKNYDIDAVKLDSIIAVFFNLGIDLVFTFELDKIVKSERKSSKVKKSSLSNEPSF